MLTLYNSLTKKKEEFIPIDPPNVNIYMCGPTVYDYIHIGNARSFIMADVVRRYLEFKEYKVKFLMNLTDVDDKIFFRRNKKIKIERGRSLSKSNRTYERYFANDRNAGG